MTKLNTLSMESGEIWRKSHTSTRSRAKTQFFKTHTLLIEACWWMHQRSRSTQEIWIFLEKKDSIRWAGLWWNQARSALNSYSKQQRSKQFLRPFKEWILMHSWKGATEGSLSMSLWPTTLVTLAINFWLQYPSVRTRLLSLDSECLMVGQVNTTGKEMAYKQHLSLICLDHSIQAKASLWQQIISRRQDTPSMTTERVYGRLHELSESLSWLKKKFKQVRSLRSRIWEQFKKTM